MLAQITSRLWWNRFLSRGACGWEELERFPRRSPYEQRKALSERLLAQIQYFGKREDALPEWREAARFTDADELWRIWPSLPIMNKKMLRERFPPAELQRRFGLTGTIKSTGGSTGEPTHVFHDSGMTLAANAASTYTRLRMGWKPGMATIIVWGSDRDVGKKKTDLRSSLYMRLLRDFVVDGYELNEATVDLVLTLIRKHQPVAVQGFTSMLAFVAKAVLDAGQALPAGRVQAAWNGGEMLYPEQNEIFRRAFGVPILNRYGGRELSVMACQFAAGGPLHVLRPWQFAEVVDQDGNPASPGQSGRLLWTSTVCRGTPLLRYEIGDVGSFDSVHESEAGISHLAGIEGRFAGLLKLPNGKTINCLYWNHLFKEFSEVRQFQVVVTGERGLEIRLEGGGMTPARDALLRRVVREFLGDVEFRIAWVERITRTRQGKLVQVVHEPEAAAGKSTIGAMRGTA